MNYILIFTILLLIIILGIFFYFFFFKKYIENFKNLKNISKKRDRNSDNYQLLLRTKNLLNSLNIPFILDFGSLLGAVREGKPIEKDQDLDVSVCETYLLILKNLNQKYINSYGLHQIRSNSWKSEKDNMVYLISYTLNEKDLKKFTLKELHGNVLYIDIYIKSYFPRNFTPISFLGMTHYIPNNVEKYLEGLYGKTWKIPSSNHAKTVHYIDEIKCSKNGLKMD